MSLSKTPPPAVKSQHATINLLDSDIARLFTHVQPVIVLSVFYLSFGLLVKDPVSALTSLLLPLATLQVAHAVLCLPPTGAHSTSSTKTTGGKTAGAKKLKKDRNELTVGHRVIPALISLVLALTLGTPLFLFIYVLLGAPITTHVPHTLLLSAHTALLTALPIIYTRGIERSTWRAIIALLMPVDETLGAAVGTLLGAWLGAVPIPLDWDRKWQKWPITVLTGAYLGWAVGKTTGGLLLKGKFIDMRG